MPSAAVRRLSPLQWAGGGLGGCAVLLAAEEAVVKLKAYVDLGFEPEEYKQTMSMDIIVRCAAAALGVSAKQLCEVVALGKAGRLMVLPEGGESDG